MKKIIYIILLTIVCGLSLSSCTEEEVTPSSELENGLGGQSSDGKN